MARFIAADLGVPAEVWRLADEAGDIDVLVNNAGALWWQPVAETPMKRFDQVMGVNVRSMVLMAQAVVPHMSPLGGGAIINVSSIACMRSTPRVSPPVPSSRRRRQFDRPHVSPGPTAR